MDYAGIALRVLVILFAAAYIAGTEHARPQEGFWVSDGTPPCLVLNDEGDRVLCTDRHDIGGPALWWISKTGPNAPAFRQEHVGPLPLSIGLLGVYQRHHHPLAAKITRPSARCGRDTSSLKRYG